MSKTSRQGPTLEKNRILLYLTLYIILSKYSLISLVKYLSKIIDHYRLSH